jgi:hypothetical protein
MRRALPLVFSLACGCTPLQWTKPDLSPEEFQADVRECRDRAWREASARSWRHQAMMSPVFVPDGGGRGFFVWPTTPLADPYGGPLLEENRLAQFCMESKGYELAPVPRP